MSCPIGEENDENCSDFVHSTTTDSSRLDSGYLTFTSPYGITPSRLSPCSVILTQLESPWSEHDPTSPIPTAKRKFLSTIDYERYISTRKYFDILTQLHCRNTSHLIDQILSNLFDVDLKSCSKVSRNWSLILKDYNRRKKTKHVKRNLFQQPIEKIKQTVKLTSTPMQTVTNLLDVKNSIPFVTETQNEENLAPTITSPERSVHLTTNEIHCHYNYLKYYHGPTITKRCPICGSVSIVDVNDQHGICTNPLCGNSFCHCCSGPYHPSSPCKISTGPIKSPWRQRPTVSPIFSNKTRTNLRRLLMR